MLKNRRKEIQAKTENARKTESSGEKDYTNWKKNIKKLSLPRAA